MLIQVSNIQGISRWLFSLAQALQSLTWSSAVTQSEFLTAGLGSNDRTGKWIKKSLALPLWPLAKARVVGGFSAANGLLLELYRQPQTKSQVALDARTRVGSCAWHTRSSTRRSPNDFFTFHVEPESVRFLTKDWKQSRGKELETKASSEDWDGTCTEAWREDSRYRCGWFGLILFDSICQKHPKASKSIQKHDLRCTAILSQLSWDINFKSAPCQTCSKAWDATLGGLENSWDMTGFPKLEGMIQPPLPPNRTMHELHLHNLSEYQKLMTSSPELSLDIEKKRSSWAQLCQNSQWSDLRGKSIVS